MSADRELLELAAKAAGYDISHPNNAARQKLNPPVDALWIPEKTTGWNPLTDDGDALRLAVQLQLTVCNEHVNCGAAYCTLSDDESFQEVRSGNGESEVIDNDYVATRRAIVLAAAEIGKKL